MRLLMVDDEESFLEQAKIFLKKEDKSFEIDTVNSPEKAIKKLQNKDYDVIISDYRMPNMDGLKLLREVRDSGSDIPFIMFTGKGREEVAMKALNIGADRYLQKGGDPTVQFRVLADAINQEVEHARTKIEKNLQRTYFQQLFEKSPEAIVLLDKEDRVIHANPAFENIFQYSIEEVEGKHLNEFIVPEDRMEEGIKVSQRVAEGGTVEGETIRKRKDGKPIDVLMLGYPVRLKNKQIGIYMLYKDITERKE
ncbi:MAG: response regulator, partial [Thermoplasmatota archaeon]